MPSFDIVVQTDLQEVENAVNQARKEIAQRYDFRGSKSRIDFDKGRRAIGLKTARLVRAVEAARAGEQKQTATEE